ncbi:toll/interleukin-1 receptor domain-containing protein [Thiothrix lacustris]|uniref:Toll/interleukin-1 receptor domain-containing protein n=1 Tax=Thiothrix lacustris TaxID=525917 RepID=A0ABY9MKL2_9GAMM|nr:toll/interleukin-1 receptor domain-containing protein [Thiothrix lacustris]WML89214.1 toll/interleukin-1 receptor domain-containing protein [Thiothrix lacustris]
MVRIPSDIEGILRTLAQVYAMQGARREVAILAKSKAEVEQTDYDNWNGGTYGYSLTLRLPAVHYAQIEADRDIIEQDIMRRMDPLLRGYQNESINSIVITLEIENDANWRRNATRWLEKVETSSVRTVPRRAAFDVFVSHASEDKESLVRPLASALSQHGFKVWYDEFELKVGDSLSKSIDSGLANSSYGIVVLSRAFFSKNWPQYELEGLTARQMVGEKVILPVWHGVTREDILRYSPSLADKLAIDSKTNTIQQMVSSVASVINGA